LPDGIAAAQENDWSGCGCSGCGEGGREVGCNEDGHLQANQIGNKRRQATIRPALIRAFCDGQQRHFVHISPSKMSCFVDDTYEMDSI
jgi:hypothetical protein